MATHLRTTVSRVTFFSVFGFVLLQAYGQDSKPTGPVTRSSDDTARTTNEARQEQSVTIPPAIQAFIQTFGTGSVSAVSPDVLSDAQSANTDRRAVIDLLQPVKHSVNSGPVTLRAISDREPGLSGLIAGTAMVLEDGTEVEAGEPLLPGDVVLLGAIVNGSDRDATVELQGNISVIAPGEVLISSACAVSCSVGCRKGSFACCNVVQGCAECNCPPNSSAQSCDTGGKNADNCGISSL